MRKSVLSSIVAAALATSCGAASAGNGVEAAPAKVKQVTLAAQVYEDGGLILKKGAVQVQHSGGSYTVYFNRNVSRCFYSVTPAVPARFTFSAQPLELNKKAVLVDFNRDGAPVPASFYIVVNCFD